MIGIENVTKKFKKKVALNDISVTFKNGVIGLLGPNGAGKTTLLRTLVGLYRVQQGQIFYNENDVTNKQEVISADTGYLPQKFGMFKELKVYDMMSYFAVLKKIPKKEQKTEIERCIEFVHLSDRMYDKVGSLSGGMIRRVGIAQAMLGNPTVMLFDEPTAGLDPEERMRFKNLIRQLGEEKIVMISTHIVDDVEAICNYIVVMNEGKVLASKSSGDIADIAKGKVFELPDSLEGSLPVGSYIRARLEDTEHNKKLIVLSSEEIEGAKPLDSTIEDGYLCLVKGIG